MREHEQWYLSSQELLLWGCWGISCMPCSTLRSSREVTREHSRHSANSGLSSRPPSSGPATGRVYGASIYRREARAIGTARLAGTGDLSFGGNRSRGRDGLEVVRTVAATLQRHWHFRGTGASTGSRHLAAQSAAPFRSCLAVSR